MVGFSLAEGEKSPRRGRLAFAVSLAVFAASIRDPRLQLPVRCLSTIEYVLLYQVSLRSLR